MKQDCYTCDNEECNESEIVEYACTPKDWFVIYIHGPNVSYDYNACSLECYQKIMNEIMKK